MDLEMTGLEPERHVIVEIATLLTDDHLNIVAEGPDLVIHATDRAAAEMGSYVTEMHTKSGLLPQIIASTITVDEAAAGNARVSESRRTLNRAPCHCAVTRSAPTGDSCRSTCPNSSRTFTIATSTSRRLKSWRDGGTPSAVASAPEKDSAHRALDDIRESINELVHYRDTLFQPVEEKQ